MKADPKPRVSSALILPLSEASYREAAARLGRGEAVVLPTETVYGIAARADSEAALSHIYALKGRDPKKPLALSLSRPELAGDYAVLCPLAKRLITAFWPGPLTLVLPAKAAQGSQLAPSVHGPDGTIALRCARAGWTQGFDDIGFDLPLALTSANLSGQPETLSARAAAQQLGSSASLYLDGGPCESGLASTIIRIVGGKIEILRAGALPAAALEPFGA